MPRRGRHGGASHERGFHSHNNCEALWHVESMPWFGCFTHVPHWVFTATLWSTCYFPVSKWGHWVLEKVKWLAKRHTVRNWLLNPCLIEIWVTARLSSGNQCRLPHLLGTPRVGLSTPGVTNQRSLLQKQEKGGLCVQVQVSSAPVYRTIDLKINKWMNKNKKVVFSPTSQAVWAWCQHPPFRSAFFLTTSSCICSLPDSLVPWLPFWLPWPTC